VRGLALERSDEGAHAGLMPPARDLFRGGDCEGTGR
jgi:hypothetical protein